jgi:thymidylate kinase
MIQTEFYYFLSINPSKALKRKGSKARTEIKRIERIETEPNKSLEPTRMLVTDPAAQAPRQAPVRLI